MLVEFAGPSILIQSRDNSIEIDVPLEDFLEKYNEWVDNCNSKGYVPLKQFFPELLDEQIEFIERASG